VEYKYKISGVFVNIIFGYAGDVDTYDVYLNYAIGRNNIVMDTMTDILNYGHNGNTI
jgi:hypothetical protein